MQYQSIKKSIRIHAKHGEKRKGLPLLHSLIDPTIIDVRHGVFYPFFERKTNQRNLTMHAINQQINGIPFQ